MIPALFSSFLGRPECALGHRSQAAFLTLFDGVVAVAVGVVGHVSEQRVVGVRVFGAQAVSICGRVGAAPPCEFTWKVMKQKNIRLTHKLQTSAFYETGCSSFFPTSIGRSCGAKIKQQLSGYVIKGGCGFVDTRH